MLSKIMQKLRKLANIKKLHLFRYKFRLVITCPAPISDADDPSKSRPNVTSFADLDLFTNQAPVGQILEV